MPKQFSKLSLVLVLIACFAGCTSMQCTAENCASDAKITADVRELLSQHTELGAAPGQLKVQTVNGVVYLHGRVNTDLMSRNAEALVWQVPNVKKVVNSLYSNAAY